MRPGSVDEVEGPFHLLYVSFALIYSPISKELPKGPAGGVGAGVGVEDVDNRLLGSLQ
jgi:hypothetical protein